MILNLKLHKNGWGKLLIHHLNWPLEEVSCLWKSTFVQTLERIVRLGRLLKEDLRPSIFTRWLISIKQQLYSPSNYTRLIFGTSYRNHITCFHICELQDWKLKQLINQLIVVFLQLTCWTCLFLIISFCTYVHLHIYTPWLEFEISWHTAYDEGERGDPILKRIRKTRKTNDARVLNTFCNWCCGSSPNIFKEGKNSDMTIASQLYQARWHVRY